MAGVIEFFDRLNLRPQERRLLLVAAVVLFVVLNLWLVRPHFGALARARNQINAATQTFNTFRSEIDRTNLYNAQLRNLEQQGTAILDEERDKDITLISTIQNQARQSGINVGPITPAPRASRTGRTNEFFEQRTLTIGVNPTLPEQLVDFLVSIAGNSLVIRVKELDLRPDPSQTRLTGSIKVVASFQRKTTVRSTPAPPAPKPSNNS